VRILLLTLALFAGRAAAADPFFLFVANRFDAPGEGERVRGVLARYFTERDYIGSILREASPELRSKIGISHTFAIPGGIDKARQYAAGSEVGLVLYDIEHWAATPAEEQKDPAAAIARASDAVRAYQGKRFGITPDGQFIGIVAGKCAVDGSKNILPRIDMTKLDFVQFQAQRLLSDRCVQEGDGVKLYLSLVRAKAGDAKARNPKILTVAQFSFRYTPPERMIEMIRALSGAVDGFYLAYPATILGTRCEYCSPQNLERVLVARQKRYP